MCLRKGASMVFMQYVICLMHVSHVSWQFFYNLLFVVQHTTTRACSVYSVSVRQVNYYVTSVKWCLVVVRDGPGPRCYCPQLSHEGLSLHHVDL